MSTLNNNAKIDPITLGVIREGLISTVREMRITMSRIAYSSVLHEARDFSCALFSAEGNLVANAPHIPVHLGSRSESVRTIIRANEGSIRHGNVYVLNAPYNGGTHLPDVPVVTPVFDVDGEQVQFYVASRGHHADIGRLIDRADQGAVPFVKRPHRRDETDTQPRLARAPHDVPDRLSSTNDIQS